MLPARLRAVLLAAVSTAALAGAAEAQSDTTYTDQLYQIRLAQGPQTVIPALGADTAVLLPMQALLRLAEIRVLRADSLGLAARLEPQRTPLRVDLATATAIRGDSVIPFSPAEAVWSAGELYASPRLLETLLGVRIQLDRTELLVVVSGTGELPVTRRRARERQRQALMDPFAARADLLDLSSSRAVADGAVLDWSYLGAADDPLGTSTVQLGLGTGSLGGGLEASVRHTRSPFDGQTDLRATWTGAWPRSSWLKQARLGDFFSGARRSQVLQGVEFSNAPYLRSAVFGAELLGGRPGTGWTVDLLRDGQLLGFAAADSTGAYQLAVPLQYGINPVEIEAIGPDGERVRQRLMLVVPFDRLPAGAVEYTVSGGRCRQGGCSGALQSNVRYGVSPAVTLEAGSDIVWRDSLSDVWAPYALVSASPIPVVHATAEIVAGSLVRGRAEYTPHADLQLEAGHTAYHGDDPQSLWGGGSASSGSDLSVFWRPRTGSQLFLQGTALRSRGAFEQRDELGASGTTSFRGGRITGGLAWVRTALGHAAPDAALRAQTAFDAVLRGPAWLRHTFVRAALVAETGDGLTGAAASVGRKVSDVLRIDVGTSWRRERGTTLELGLSTDFRGARLASHSRFAPGSGIAGTQSAEGSVVWNARDRRVEFGNGRSIGRSAVVGVVFIDTDGNGRRDPGEETVPDVRVRLGSRGVRADSSGQFEAWDLVPFEVMTAEIHAPSLDNPLFVPAAPGVRFAPRPNTVERVDLALVPAGELSGTVGIAGTARTIGGIRVTLRHLASGTAVQVTTFGDGTFFASGLRPGTYVVELEPEPLADLGLTQPPTRVSVRSYDAGADAPAVTIEVVPAPADPAADR